MTKYLYMEYPDWYTSTAQVVDQGRDIKGYFYAIIYAITPFFTRRVVNNLRIKVKYAQRMLP